MNLHDELTSLAQAAGSYADAGKAVTLAKAQSRRRIIVATMAALVALALLPVTAWGLGNNAPPPAADDPAHDPEVAMLIGAEQVRYGDGKEITLPEPATGLGDLFMTSSGLLFNGSTSLYMIDDNGEADTMGDPVGRIRISPDGDRGAWRARSGDLVNAQFGNPAVLAVQSTPTDGDVFPLAVFGDTVLVGSSVDPDTYGNRWDTWDSAAGDFEPEWKEDPLLYTVFGPEEGDSGAVLAFISSGDRDCMATLLPVEDEVVQSVCDLGSAFDGERLLSPDQRMLYELENGEFLGLKDYVDMTTDDLKVTKGCPRGHDAVWVDDRTVAINTAKGDLVTCTYREEGKPGVVTIPDVNATALIPSFGM